MQSQSARAPADERRWSMRLDHSKSCAAWLAVQRFCRIQAARAAAAASGMAARLRRPVVHRTHGTLDHIERNLGGCRPQSRAHARSRCCRGRVACRC